MVMVVSAFELGSWYMFLALALVLNSALSLFIMLVIRVMYMANKDVEYKMSTNQSNVINIKEFTAATIEMVN